MSVSDKVTGMTLVGANGDIITYDFTKLDSAELYVNALKVPIAQLLFAILVSPYTLLSCFSHSLRALFLNGARW